jgi:hypothetical protein
MIFSITHHLSDSVTCLVRDEADAFFVTANHSRSAPSLTGADIELKRCEGLFTPSIIPATHSCSYEDKETHLEIARGDTRVVFALGKIELSKAPVDEAQLAIGVVNHDVVRFDVAMHDALGVRVIECAKQLEHVVPDVVVCKGGIEYLRRSQIPIN